MSRARFTTARDVFDAFPSAAAIIRTASAEGTPIAFLRLLADGPTPEEAIAFAAFLLDRREAVWWAAQSMRMFGRIAPGEEDAPLSAAEAWVREPEETRRREALRLGMAGDPNVASSWVALAAGWSGGSISPASGPPIAPGPELTPKAVRTAILVALARVSAQERAARLAASIDAAAKLFATRSDSA